MNKTELFSFLWDRCEEEIEVTDSDIAKFISNKIDNGDLLCPTNKLEDIEINDDDKEAWFAEFLKFIQEK